MLVQSFSWSLTAASLLATAALAAAKGSTFTTFINPKPGNGLASGDFLSTANTLDAPKVSNFNSTSWDWWYFDAASTTNNASVVIVFFASTPAGFPFNNRAQNLTSALIWLTTANGTLLPTLTFDANGAEVTTEQGKDGASGVWKGSGFSFTAEKEGRRYLVNVDVPSVGLKGELRLDSEAPAHHPNSIDKAGANMEVLPSIGWSNQLPDAKARAKFTLPGSCVSFDDGVGYHDKNWGLQPMIAATKYWYWGHARLDNEYSIVWFDAFDHAEKEYVSAYVAKNGKVIASMSKAGSVKVRPTGPGTASTFPPTVNSTWPTGYTMDFVLPDASVLNVNITNQVTLVGIASYLRFKGVAQGRLSTDKGRLLRGNGIWEQFNIPALLAGGK